MSLKDEQICRLCLKVAKDEFKIDGIKKEMFEILLLKLNLDITRDPIICQDCMEVAKNCLNFKYSCITTEQIILSYSAGGKMVKYDIKVIYQDSEYEQTVFNGDFNVCRFCMTRLEISNCSTFEALMSDSMLELLPQYMVEMDFNTIENPMACAKCKKSLDGYFKFVLNCLDMEEKIIEYCKEEGTDNMGQVKLSNVLLFMFTTIVEYSDKCSQICKFKQEHTECVKVYRGLIKQEELDIKDEEMILDGTFYRNISEINVKRKSINNNCDASETDMDEYRLSTFEVKQQHILKNQNSIRKGEDISVDMGIYPVYKCSFCACEAKQESNLTTHMLVHKDVSQIKMYKCPLCSYEAKHKSSLTAHMLFHKDVSKIKMHKCSLCTYEAKQKRYLTGHTLVHKNDSELRMHKCSLCSYETKRKSNLTRHMLVHKDVSEIRTYKCSLCGYEAKRKSYLVLHMLVHKDVSQIEMYKCSLCSYEAKLKSSLKKHILIHKDVSEIKMHKCSLCTYEARQKSSLTRHMLIHKDVSEIRTYKCSLCAYETKRKDSLKDHAFIHKDVSEIKMYKCSLCTYEAKQKYYLRRHMLVHK